jgi:hypothetical protein
MERRDGTLTATLVTVPLPLLNPVAVPLLAIVAPLSM